MAYSIGMPLEKTEKKTGKRQKFFGTNGTVMRFSYESCKLEAEVNIKKYKTFRSLFLASEKGEEVQHESDQPKTRGPGVRQCFHFCEAGVRVSGNQHRCLIIFPRSFRSWGIGPIFPLALMSGPWAPLFHERRIHHLHRSGNNRLPSFLF